VPVAAGERPEVVVLEVSGDLHYAAVPPFLTEADRLIPDTSRQVVIDLSHAHELRFTALTALEQLAQAARHDGAALILAGVDPGTRALLDRSGSTLPYVPAEDEPGLSVRLALERLRQGPTA
jgi:MFS superfamily sulfate permease-like transporter